MTHPLGQLRALQTADGSLSLHSDHFDEAFHSSAGALEETETKFVRPSELGRFSQTNELKLLDVCFGLGYNSAAVMAALPSTSPPWVQWWGLEVDPLRSHYLATFSSSAVNPAAFSWAVVNPLLFSRAAEYPASLRRRTSW